MGPAPGEGNPLPPLAYPPPAQAGVEDAGGRHGVFPVPWSWVDALGVFGVSLAAGIVAGILVFVVGGAVGLAENVIEVLLLPLSLAVLGVSCVGWVRVRYPDHVWRLRGPTVFGWRQVMAGLGWGLLAYLVITIGLGWLLEVAADLSGTELPTVQEEFREYARDPEVAPIFIVGAVVFAPVAEELFFRGMLFQALRRRLGVWPAVILSAVAFSAAHAQPGTTALANGLVAIVILPLGMALAWLFHRRGSLIVPILVHAVFNGIGVVALLLGYG